MSFLDCSLCDGPCHQPLTHGNFVMAGTAREVLAKARAQAEAGTIESTLAERGTRYGVFADQAVIAQEIKDAMRKGRNWDLLSPDQKEALDMNANKTARILNGDPNYHDSWHDIVGYTKLVADRLKMG